jgi:hypothetical protein
MRPHPVLMIPPGGPVGPVGPMDPVGPLPKLKNEPPNGKELIVKAAIAKPNII